MIYKYIKFPPNCKFVQMQNFSPQGQKNILKILKLKFEDLRSEKLKFRNFCPPGTFEERYNLEAWLGPSSEMSGTDLIY